MPPPPLGLPSVHYLPTAYYFSDTQEYIHHREDHNHLLKRIIACLREGMIPGLDLRYMREALHDPTTGLTYEALTGKNKQSVPDCERIITTGVIKFLERKGHKSGADILTIIRNWHRAVDGRGLSESERSQFCQDMKCWLLDDWVPWHRDNSDYSLIDVNRLVTLFFRNEQTFMKNLCA
jgi:hypothetical protein